MAVSGTIKTTYVDSFVGDIDAVLTWNRTSVSTENNTSTIAWELSLVSYGDLLALTSKKYYYIQIHGQEYEGEANINIGSKETKVLASGELTLTHSTDGTRTFAYNFLLEGGLYAGSNKSASGIGELDAIYRHATITSAPDFNDEENPTITYYNPAGNAVTSLQAAIYYTSGQASIVRYRDIDKTGTSYTFNLTDAERTALRNAVTSGSTLQVRFYVTSKVDGITNYSSLEKTLSLINHEPTLSPTVVATDARTKELTGDTSGKTIIRYVSDVSFNTGSAARKGATIEYHTIRNGSNVLDDYTSKTGTMTDVTSNTFYFSATDSRGNTTNDFVVFSEDNNKFIPYIKPSNRIDSTSLSGSGVLTVNISGQYFSGSFGAKSNTMDIDYSVRDEDGNYITNPSGSGWSILTNVSPTVDGNQYTYEFTVSGLDHEKRYIIEVYVVDEITNASSSSKVIASIPVFDWSKTDFAHHTDVNIDENKSIFGKKTDGSTVRLLGYAGSALDLGLGGYNNKSGRTSIYGDALYLYSNGAFAINGYGLADFVVQEETSGTWYYRKWKSGRCELYGYQNVSSIACNTALGSMYRTAVITPPNFPFTVYSPKLVASYESEGYGAFFWATTLTTTAKPSNYYLVRPSSSAAITGKVHFHVQGSWK